MSDRKKCSGCGLIYEVSEERVTDVGTGFGPEFRYTCPECDSANGDILGEQNDG